MQITRFPHKSPNNGYAVLQRPWIFAHVFCEPLLIHTKSPNNGHAGFKRSWTFAHVFCEPLLTCKRRVCVLFSPGIWDSLRLKYPPKKETTKYLVRKKKKKRRSVSGWQGHILYNTCTEFQDISPKKNLRLFYLGRSSWNQLVYERVIRDGYDLPPCIQQHRRSTSKHQWSKGRLTWHTVHSNQRKPRKIRTLWYQVHTTIYKRQE